MTRVRAPNASCACSPDTSTSYARRARARRWCAHTTPSCSNTILRGSRPSKLGAAFPHSVTYHSACHANRELGIADDARTLLKNVRGLELREMKAAEECCGF